MWNAKILGWSRKHRTTAVGHAQSWFRYVYSTPTTYLLSYPRVNRRKNRHTGTCNTPTYNLHRLSLDYSRGAGHVTSSQYQLSTVRNLYCNRTPNGTSGEVYQYIAKGNKLLTDIGLLRLNVLIVSSYLQKYISVYLWTLFRIVIRFLLFWFDMLSFFLFYITWYMFWLTLSFDLVSFYFSEREWHQRVTFLRNLWILISCLRDTLKQKIDFY